jgi:hypothetical protein
LKRARDAASTRCLQARSRAKVHRANTEDAPQVKPGAGSV